MKTLLCFLLSALCLSAHGQAVLRSAFLQSFRQTASAPAECASWLTQTTDADWWNLGPGSQAISNTVARTVCKVLVKMENTSSSHAFEAYVQLRSAANGGGSQYGNNSTTNSLPAASAAAWYEFTWSSNPTTAAEDFYLTVVKAGTLETRVHTSASNVYLDTTTYTYWDGSAQRDNADMCFEIWVE